MTRFSIITVTYNAERYLEETCASVASQEFSDHEHIIWDGGSKDKTLEIVRSFPRVKLFQGKDIGIADAMNKGAEKAEGEFLIHLHADDLFSHSKVLTFIDSALKQHSEALWMYGKIGLIDELGFRKERSAGFHLFNYQRLKKYNCIPHPAVCISRKLFIEQGGFDSTLRYVMDYDLWLRLAKVSEPFSLPAELALFPKCISEVFDL